MIKRAQSLVAGALQNCAIALSIHSKASATEALLYQSLAILGCSWVHILDQPSDLPIILCRREFTDHLGFCSPALNRDIGGANDKRDIALIMCAKSWICWCTK